MKRKLQLTTAKMAGPVMAGRRNKTPTHNNYTSNTYTNLLSPNESFHKARGTMQNFSRKTKNTQSTAMVRVNEEVGGSERGRA